MTPLPTCDCASPGFCPRYGEPMVGRLYQICSGTCPAENPCSDKMRAGYFAKWGGKATGKTAGRPGTELKGLLKSLGIEASGGCGCNDKATAMDAWGVAGCRGRKQEILGWLREAHREMTWTAWVSAVTNAVATGLVLSMNPLDPLGSLLNEALRRAEAKEVQS